MPRMTWFLYLRSMYATRPPCFFSSISFRTASRQRILKCSSPSPKNTLMPCRLVKKTIPSLPLQAISDMRVYSSGRSDRIRCTRCSLASRVESFGTDPVLRSRMAIPDRIGRSYSLPGLDGKRLPRSSTHSTLPRDSRRASATFSVTRISTPSGKSLYTRARST